MLTGSSFMKQKENPDGSNAWVRQLGLFSVIVGDLVGYTGAGVALGYLAQTKLHFSWWVMPITSLVGLCLSMYRIYLRTRGTIGS